MKVWIKDLSVDMEIKNAGMELAVYSPDNKTFLGDLVITKSGLEWCRGKTAAGNGVKVKWQDFIADMEKR